MNIPAMIKSLQDYWNSTFFTSCLLCLSLGIHHAALAEYKKTAENDAPQGNETTITGSRGVGSCGEEAVTSLTALAPYGHMGKSASTHPTFAWYIPDLEAYPVKFRLYEYDATKRNGQGKTIAKETLSSTQGIMTYSLPSDFPGLTAGQKYIWRVVLVCNPNSPSQSLLVGTGINIVSQNPEIVSQLNNTSDRTAKANIYAEAGLWYDALAEVVVDADDPQANAFTNQLLEQLTKIEQQDSVSPGNVETKASKIQQQHQQQLAEITAALNENNK